MTPRPDSEAVRAAVPTDTQHEPLSGSTPAASTRSLLSGYGLLVISNVGGQALGLIGLIAVARRLGPHNLGAYGFAVNLAAYFALPFMAGAAMVAMRELATAGHSRRKTVAEVQGFLLLNAAIAYLVLIALSPVLSPDSLTRTLLALTGLTLVINAVGLDWAMQGMQRLKPLALYRFLGQVAYLVVLLAVLTGGKAGTVRYALCNALGFSVTAALTLVYVRRELGLKLVTLLPTPRHIPALLRDRAHRSLAPAISLMMIQVYYSVDFVLLGYLRGAHAVGEYTTASRFPLAVTGLASLWVTAFYPHAAALFHTDRQRLRRQVGQFSSLSLLAALPLVPFGFVMGRQIMTGLFGAAYAPSGTAFAILLTSAAAALVNANIGQVLLACGDDKAFLVSVTVGAVLNVALNVALIPPLGIAGSALATLVAECAVIAAVSVRLWHTMGRIDLEWGRLARCAVGLSGASVVLVLLKPVAPWWGTLVAASVAYGVLLVAVRAVAPAEVRRLLRPTR